jgi:8-amino-7-oxononanoate synthase
MSRRTDRLSASDKSALLQSLRANVRASEPAKAPKPVATKTWDTSFESLPAFQVFKTQRAAADVLGISNPFYRQHDAKAGAESQIGNQHVLNFASYDYLGLNGHPEITKAVAETAAQWGTSVSASRITAGERGFHRKLERAIADVYDAEDSVVFVSGHATAVTAIAALVGSKDLVIHDALIHNCVMVGTQLSGSARRVFPHNDLDVLESILENSRDSFERVLIVAEGLYSMDGDGPDLARLVEIKERWGAWLLVDEAHSIGVLGKTGRGIFEMQGVDPRRVDLWLGTLSKTLVSCGGYIAGSHALVDYMKFAANGMVYSVGMPGPATVASLVALDIMKREPERVAKLQANGKLFMDKARAAGLDVGSSWGYAVTPIIVGDTLRTVILADRLLKRGINAFPIIPPGVPEKSARLRFFISASHTPEQIEAAVQATQEELSSLEAAGLAVGTANRLLKR